jgi:hypothetical protein
VHPPFDHAELDRRQHDADSQQDQALRAGQAVVVVACSNALLKMENTRVVVLPLGPPSVITWTWPSAWRALSVVVTTTKNTLGEIIGSTTLKKFRSPVAPSIRAASSTSSSTPARPAPSTSRLNPATTQVVAQATVISAHGDSVVQPGAVSPASLSSQFTGDMDGSSISSHTTLAADAE